MESVIEYEILKHDIKVGAKIARRENYILKKVHRFPGFMMDILSREGAKSAVRYFEKGCQQKRLTGFQIPFDRLETLTPLLSGKIPTNCLMVSDVNTEVFYYKSIKEEKKSFYTDSASIPKEISAMIRGIHASRKGKQTKHTDMWTEICSKPQFLVRLVNFYIKRQLSFGIDVVCPPTPLIITVADLDFVERVYEQSLRLYHGELVDIEREQGKVISLFLNIQDTFLEKAENINQLLLTIDRLAPRALVFKISNLGDLRVRPNIVNQWRKLMKGIGKVSYEHGFMTIYLSASTDGLISLAYGIDCFTQMPNKNDNIEKEFVMTEQILQRRREDPYFLSGKIYLYDMKDSESRSEFQKRIAKMDVLPYPMEELSTFTPADVKSMSDPTFREFSKFVLMLCRSQEIEEFDNAIQDGTISTLGNRFSEWDKDKDVFP